MKKSLVAIAALLIMGSVLPAQLPNPLGLPDPLNLTDHGRNSGPSRQEPRRREDQAPPRRPIRRYRRRHREMRHYR